MGTTSNYSWPIPEDTDLVKDGAEAIRDLGNAIDTSAADFGGGLVHIKTADTGGAVASFSIDDCFNANHNMYRIVFDLSTSVDAELQARLRVGGTDTITNYSRQRLIAINTSVSGSRSTGDTSWVSVASDNDAAGKMAGWFEIHNPFATNITNAFVNMPYYPGGDFSFRMYTYGHTGATSFTGLTVFPSTGTIDGKVSILGYKI
jgi:hypothetical protein